MSFLKQRHRPGDALPCKLRRSQQEVTFGVGEPGKANGIVLFITSTWQRKTAAGSRTRVSILDHFAGAALGTQRGGHHVDDERFVVLTAYHALAERLQKLREQKEVGLQLWAIPAFKYEEIKKDDKWELGALMKSGAVQAKGYRSAAKDQGMTHDTVLKIPGMDIGIVTLGAPLKDLPAGQPQILLESQLSKVTAYLKSMNGNKLRIMIEGLGSHTCRSQEKCAAKGNTFKVS
jgi:hypothetical protein